MLVPVLFGLVVTLGLLPVTAAGGTTGTWIESFVAATNLAYSTKTPLVLVWSKDGCDHCDTLDEMFNTTAYRQWMASSDYVFCHVKGDSNWNDVGINKGTGAKKYTETAGGLCKNNKSIKGTPYVSLLWNVTGALQGTNFMARSGTMLVSSSGRSLFSQFSESVDTYFESIDVVPVVTFACGNTVGDRLEATIDYTTYVDVPLTRDIVRVSGPMTNQLTWTYGSRSGSKKVIWTKGMSEQVVRLSTDFAGAKVNDKIVLTLSDGKNSRAQESAITFVDRENSPKNPLWIGARTEEQLAWGEWTMDFIVATNKVAAFNATNGTVRAYSLILVAGGLWCPDCARNDAYVIDTPEFKKWTKENRVACVCIDIPSDPTVGGPCLLNRQVKEVSAKYQAADPEKGVYQSGTGYLSRWMIPDAEAEKIEARNAAFVGVNTLNGGWNRPERANQKRTGVPIFILLREDGSIAGRIETFASTSPDDATYIKGNLRRLSELLTTIDDSEEESNFHPSTTKMSLNASSDSAVVSLSGADQADTFHLTNTIDYARLTVTASGVTSGGLENKLSIWSKANGVAQIVASTTGRFADGALSVSADLSIPGADYFARIELVGLGDLATFGQDVPLTSDVSLNTALTYVSGTVAFDTDEQIVNVLDGEGTVSISRTGGMFGMASAIVSVVEPGTAVGCYEFIETNLTWASGEVGTKEVRFEVFRNDDLAEGEFVLGLKAGPGNMAGISSRRHTVELEDTTDPTFNKLNIEVSGYSNFAAGEVLPLRNIDPTKTVRLKKVTGSLPSGVRLSYDKNLGAAVLSGTPKTPGTYSVAYTVTQNGVTGLPAVITITVEDPKEKNAFVNEARSSQDIPLFVPYGTNDVLAGTLKLSVSSKNKISARYSGTELKTISFSGSWQTIRDDGTAYALLEKNGNVLELEMDGVGGVSATVSVLSSYSAFADPLSATVTLTGESPYPTTNYADWAGYYTVTLVDAEPEAERIEPFGTGYLTLTVKETGKVSWKGVLADGTSVSGTSCLDWTYVDNEGDAVAEVTIFKRTTKDVLGVKLAIKANSDLWFDDLYAQMIHHVAGAPAYVLHRTTALSYLTTQFAYGGWYVKAIAPSTLCATFGYDDEDIRFVVSTERLADSEKYGAPLSITEAQIVADDKTLSLGLAPAGMRFSFLKSGGTFSGSATMVFDSGASVKGTFKGVLMPGWSGCGQCVEGRTLVDRPFGSGTFYFKDSLGGLSVVRSCPVDLLVKTKESAE